MNSARRKNQKLRILSLGGWSGVHQNMFVYETDDDILVVDCGIGFPDETMPGVEVIVPDVSYLVDRVEKIRGVIITHGHVDHYGALPFVLPRIGNPPVFATRLVRRFIQARLAEFAVTGPKLHLIDPDDNPFDLGPFEIAPFRVNHSVPDSIGLCLNTSAGRIFHVSDFKFDLTPVDGKVFQIGKAARLAYPKVLILISDCLGAIASGFTGSEREIEGILSQIIREARGQVFVTTVSSNISRFQQAIRVSLQHNRKIVILGRSVREKIDIARELGYLKLNQRNVVSPQKARKLPQDKLTYLVGGSYGQPNSALARLAEGTYRDVKLEEGAVVVFSADPAPPGAREAVDLVVDNLILKGAHLSEVRLRQDVGAGAEELRQLALKEGVSLFGVGIVEPLRPAFASSSRLPATIFTISSLPLPSKLTLSLFFCLVNAKHLVGKTPKLTKASKANIKLTSVE